MRRTLLWMVLIAAFVAALHSPVLCGAMVALAFGGAIYAAAVENEADRVARQASGAAPEAWTPRPKSAPGSTAPGTRADR